MIPLLEDKVSRRVDFREVLGYVTGGYRECRRCVGMVADGSDIELYIYG